MSGKVKKAAKAAKKVQKVVKTIQKVPVLRDLPLIEHPLETIGGLGGPAGRSVGKFLGKVTGTGDYEVRVNSLMKTSSQVLGGHVPRFSKTKDEYGTIINHHEFVMDITSSSTPGAFNNLTFALNPGNKQLYPWLSTVAQLYDQWMPLGIVFTFISSSGEVTTSQALGTVVMASDYDVTDLPYASKAEMNNSQYSVSGKPSVCMYHPIECDPGQRPIRLLKCRNLNSAPTDNLQWYDLCNFQIASVGIPNANVTLGELYVSYEIAFYKEQIPLSITSPLALGSDFLCLSTSITNYFGTSRTAPVGNSLATIFPTTSSLSIVDTNIGVGAFFSISVFWIGTAAICSTPTLTLTNCVAATTTAGDATANADANNGGVTDDVFAYFRVLRVTGPNPTVAFSAGGIPTSSLGALRIRLESPSLYA